MSLALRYSLFAALATLANLLTQDVTLLLFDHQVYALYVAMATGTLLGLYAKYVLDKRYIFAYRTRDATHDVRTFMLYATTGAFTTLIFWACELGFYHAFGTHAWRTAGAVIGLSIGYWLKYRLDRRFAFATAADTATG